MNSEITLEKLNLVKPLIQSVVDEYKELNSLYTEKTDVLVKGTSEDLVEIDNKIKEKFHVIATLQNTWMKKLSIKNVNEINLTYIEEQAAKFDLKLADEYKEIRNEISKLVDDLKKNQMINRELVHHGLKLVGKKLNLINEVAGGSEYDATGRSSTDRIKISSTIVEEV